MLVGLMEWRDPFGLNVVKAAPEQGELPLAQAAAALPQWLPQWAGQSRRAHQAQPVETSLKVVVKLSARQVRLYQDQTLLHQFPAAIGQAEWQTPVGSFTVMEMQQNPAWQHPITGQVVPAGPKNPLGSRWIGFWSDGSAHVGFHGTNQAELIGQAVSHGCVRMRNQDIATLYSYLQVGTPVVVEP
jgi:lipoprotein-anchoring transpeptidase ErfK/SrfK